MFFWYTNSLTLHSRLKRVDVHEYMSRNRVMTFSTQKKYHKVLHLIHSHFCCPLSSVSSFRWLIIVYTLPWIMVIKQIECKKKKSHLSLLTAYFSQPHWAEGNLRAVRSHTQSTCSEDQQNMTQQYNTALQMKSLYLSCTHPPLENRRAEPEKQRNQIAIDETRKKEAKRQQERKRDRGREKNS